MKFTVSKITLLESNQIFVFGSNEGGHHGLGAAKQALSYGAKLGKGYGLSGNSFAIPTKKSNYMYSLSLYAVGCYVDKFISEIDPNKVYLVTRIGCGLAGFKDEEIAPLFKKCLTKDNVQLPIEWENLMDGNMEPIIKFNFKSEKYSYMSNFFEHQITCTIAGHDLTFRNVEAAFQAYKYLFCSYSKDDNFMEENIPKKNNTPKVAELMSKFTNMTGYEAKQAGKKIPNLITEIWDCNRVKVMKLLLDKKFSNYNLKIKLDDTRGELQEDTNDSFWGGKSNKLGKLLMNKRNEIGKALNRAYA